MKFSEVSKTKEAIMSVLEKAVDEVLDQLQANQEIQAAANDTMPNLVPGLLDVKMVLDLPKHEGTNGEGFKIACNPIVMLKNVYLHEGIVDVRKEINSKKWSVK